MDDTAPLASLSLTHVHYNPDDVISYACAWLALVPQGLCVVYSTLVWSTREIEIILMFAGQLACEAFNWGLKRWIKEARPKQMNGKGYGMPSSHAQFVAFFAVSLALFLLTRHQPRPSESYEALSWHRRVLLSMAVIIGAATVAASRVYLRYHTPKQVLVGVSAGLIFAVLWFHFTSLARRRGWLNAALEHPLLRAFRVRDLLVEEDPMEAGWARWEQKRVTRLQGRASPEVSTRSDHRQRREEKRT